MSLCVSLSRAKDLCLHVCLFRASGAERERRHRVTCRRTGSLGGSAKPKKEGGMLARFAARHAEPRTHSLSLSQDRPRALGGTAARSFLANPQDLLIRSDLGFSEKRRYFSHGVKKLGAAGRGAWARLSSSLSDALQVLLRGAARASTGDKGRPRGSQTSTLASADSIDRDIAAAGRGVDETSLATGRGEASPSPRPPGTRALGPPDG